MGGSSSKKFEYITFNPITPNKIKLDNNKECPLIGLGTILIIDEKGKEVVIQSIKDGVRLIDTAPSNEIVVGNAINEAIKKKIVKREDLFIVTKLELEEKKDPEEALKKSLKRLGLEYVDLYLDHWPSCFNFNKSNPKNEKLIPVKETWIKMENLVNLGLTKSIGVSNYNVENLFNILSICTIKPCVNEVEFHPYLYQKELKEFCDKENIKLFSYNPLVKGSYFEKNDIYDQRYDLFRESIVITLDKKYEKITKGQIILNWHMSLGVIPITGTLNPNRMKENLDAQKFRINKNIYELIGNEENQHRFYNGSHIFGINIFA